MRALRIGVLLISAAACGGDDATDVPVETMSATLDGAPWTAFRVEALVNNDLVVVTGIDTELVGLAIAFPFEGPSSYSIGTDDETLGGVIDGETQWLAGVGGGGTGEIHVTSLDATGASGTFSFSAPLQTGAGSPAIREVVEGAFSVTF